MIEPGTTIKPLVRLPSNPADCWVWLGGGTGNGLVPSKRFQGRSMPARKWLWEMLFGPLADWLTVAMVCGNEGCVSPYHMRAVTTTELVRGSCAAKLLPADVAEIKRAGKTARGPGVECALAARFGVHCNTIYDIWAGRSWRGRGDQPRARKAARPSVATAAELPA